MRRMFRQTLAFTLFVSLPLALALGCSIDDRDLEVRDGEAGDSSRGGSSSGGSSGRGGTGGGRDPLCAIEEDDDGCIACDKTYCCDEYAACLSSADCTSFVLCGYPCADQECLIACANEFPEGYEEFVDWTACSDANGCLDAC